jgi:hypothetical protein
VKDVLRYERLFFTSAAYDSLRDRLNPTTKETADGRP